MEDEKHVGRYDFVKLGSLYVFGMRTTLNFLHGFGIWPIVTESL